MRIENIGFGELKLIQNPDEFCFGVDAVILADFATSIHPGFKRALDLCTGTGIVPFVLSHKGTDKESKIIGVDVQPQSIDMAKEGCKLNGLEERIGFLNMDVDEVLSADSIKDVANDSLWQEALSDGGFDMITINPPYVAKGSGIANGNMGKFIARQETTVDLEGFVKASSKLLKRKGHFFMVHRPSRLVDIMFFCRKHRLEPKTLRFVSPRENEQPNILLIHCIKDGGKEIKVLNNLCVYDNDGGWSKEIVDIYEKNRY